MSRSSRIHQKLDEIERTRASNTRCATRTDATRTRLEMEYAPNLSRRIWGWKGGNQAGKAEQNGGASATHDTHDGKTPAPAPADTNRHSITHRLYLRSKTFRHCTTERRRRGQGRGPSRKAQVDAHSVDNPKGKNSVRDRTTHVTHPKNARSSPVDMEIEEGAKDAQLALPFRTEMQISGGTWGYPTDPSGPEEDNYAKNQRQAPRNRSMPVSSKCASRRLYAFSPNHGPRRVKNAFHQAQGSEHTHVLPRPRHTFTKASPGTRQSREILTKEQMISAISATMKPSKKHATAEQQAQYPLHIKNVATATLMERWRHLLLIGEMNDVIQTRNKTQSPDREEPNSKYTSYADHFWSILQLLKKIKRSHHLRSQANDNTPTDLSRQDTEALVRAGLLRHYDVNSSTKSLGLIQCRSFTVFEPAKLRRRWITHTNMTNGVLGYRVPVSMKRHTTQQDAYPLPCPTEIVRTVLQPAAVAVDFTAYYHQFALGPAFANIFGVGNYALTTIPTGSDFAPALAQIYTQALCDHVCLHYPGVHSEAYIDNVRLSGEHIILPEALKLLYEVATFMKISINESFTEAVHNTDEYTFLGVHYCHRERYVTLSEKSRNKVVDIPLVFPDTGTLRLYLSLYGVLGYASQVLQISRAPYYYATKFLRRQIGKHLDEVTSVWPAAWNHLMRWKMDVLKKTKYFPQEWSHPKYGPLTVYTDASSKGFGVVAFGTDGRVHVIAEPFKEEFLTQPIVIKETFAVLEALSQLDMREIAYAEFWIDNTSSLGAIRKTQSANFTLNSLVNEITTHPNFKKVRSLSYVHTSENHADAPSRSHQPVNWYSHNPFLWQHFQILFGHNKLR